MRKALLVVFLLGWSWVASAQSVRLDWDAVTLDVNDQPENIQGYYLSWGTQSGSYTDGFSTGNLIYGQVDDLTNTQTYYFVVKAIDQFGNESAWSNEATWPVPVEDCENLVDDDYDGLTDCQDSECGSGAEVCDGFDNDCDGQTDNGLNGPDCPLQQGVCAGARQTCGGAAGWLTCNAASYGADYQASETRCDGLDNDCDGQTDELAGPDCPLQQGVCAGSSQRCLGSGGWAPCDATDYGSDYEQDETLCDALDNDCDGSTDEGVGGCCVEGLTRPCSTDVGECSAGQQTCDAIGTWGACDGVMPVNETCNGLDDDCDGNADEGLAGASCPLQVGVCAGAVQRCGGAQSWLPCDGQDYGPDYGQIETVCDGLDNDCDDLTDEDDVCQPSDGGTDGGLDDGGDPGGDAGGDTGAEIEIRGGCACSASTSGGSALAWMLLWMAWLGVVLRRRDSLRR